MPSVSNLTATADSYSTGHASWINSGDTAFVTVSITGPGTPQVSVNPGGASANFTSLNASSTYTVTVTPQDSNHVNGTPSSTTFTTPANPNVPPSGSTTITPTPIAGHQFSVSWTAVSGATGYYLYKSSDHGTTWFPWSSSSGADVGNVTSKIVPIDFEWNFYKFKVTPYNSFGNGPDSISADVKSLDETAPSMSAFYATQTLSNQVTVYATGNDNNPTSGTPSGILRFRLYKNGVFDGYATVNGPSNNTTQSQYYTFTGLTAGTTYIFEARAEDYSGNLSPARSFTINVTTTNGRPANFDWDMPKTAGSTFVAPTAVEWGKFQTRINDFRQYKGLATYSFTAVSGTGMASDYNAARTAIMDMTPPTAPPAAVVGIITNPTNPSPVTAAQFNGIRDSLNSIQ